MKKKCNTMVLRRRLHMKGKTMRCPYCGNEAIIDQIALAYVEAYDNNAISKSLCCGGLLNVTPVFAYKISPVFTKSGDKVADDWGKSGHTKKI